MICGDQCAEDLRGCPWDIRLQWLCTIGRKNNNLFGEKGHCGDGDAKDEDYDKTWVVEIIIIIIWNPVLARATRTVFFSGTMPLWKQRDVSFSLPHPPTMPRDRVIFTQSAHTTIILYTIMGLPPCQSAGCGPSVRNCTGPLIR